MKKILLFVLGSVFFISTYAQITILSDDLMDVGDSVQLASVDTIPAGFKPGPAGPDQNWDFSNLIMDTTMILSFVDPSSTPYGTNFPSSNIAVEGMVEGLAVEGWAYGTKSVFLFQIDGVAGSYDIFEDIVVPFDPPEIIFDFPVNYLDSLEQTTTIDIRMDSPEPAADSIRIKVVTAVDSRVDAWGEVITPVWTGDVLRFRDVRVMIDSSWVKILFFWVFLETNTTTTITYKYMANDVGYPVMQFNSDTSGTEYSMINYLLDAGLGESELYLDNDVVFDIYPNPASTEVYIRLQQADINGTMLICDMRGRKMDAIQLFRNQQQLRIDISDYPAGLYHVILKNESRILGQKKFVVN
ncbi:MAG: T9SS type A sorting domain-containing protein [Bacteroidales bacterium]|nr:T9SS type A sorting domain-containing protein [Bacteroidales bacterium]